MMHSASNELTRFRHACREAAAREHRQIDQVVAHVPGGRRRRARLGDEIFECDALVAGALLDKCYS